ncbi:MAG: SDR family oxidoreductase [Anaerolineales bacterium]|jgi:NAD(P)-dependent dehydrogenase (short-subunit alcohol dehydrogenase family)
MLNVASKVVVITGGTRGLGLEIARALSNHGASVVICSRSQESVNRALESLRADRLTAHGMACDVANLDEVKALARVALQQHGRIDVWFNNAGISGPYGPTLDLRAQDFESVLNTNIFGTYHGSLIALRQFVSQGSGKLINIIGAGAKRPIAFQNAYASSKSWIRNFTLALAKEVEGRGVEAMVYQPGLMDTDLIRKVDVIEGYAQRLDPFKTVIQLLGKHPRVAAKKAVWLASSATDGKNGLETRAGGMLTMLGSVLRFLGRRLTGQEQPEVELDIHRIPPESDPLQ